MTKEKFRNIESFKDIDSEKERLNLQIQLAEEKIYNDFTNLSNKLTFASIASQIKESALGTIYQAFRMGYNLFFRSKNKSD